MSGSLGNVISAIEMLDLANNFNSCNSVSKEAKNPCKCLQDVGAVHNCKLGSNTDAHHGTVYLTYLRQGTFQKLPVFNNGPEM